MNLATESGKGLAGMDDSRPIFLQVAERIEAGVLDGTYAEEAQVPSTNEFAAFMRINPATAGKGINRLVESGVLYKKRGIGMFVAQGARAQLLEARRESFAEQYIEPLLQAAAHLDLGSDELVGMIREAAQQTTGDPR
ncbi:DNA-binding transcriptional regulator YhcF (GntR family) [Zhihengliuella halotolerans]|uniref:DNA-binding transcriptional regulator YhcF (GntR family) n=2 Tax=Zhihengliuella halotolerans TaxID=370736 RepID=A0A4Q8AI30_9MICC|nr:DNA-binding transcriptional regulator YhcF (GntR family) [Zhihengliuella halotolerans]